MKFLVDESVEYPIVSYLRSFDYDVHAVAEESAGVTDERVLEVAHRQRRILITNDKDFGTLVFYRGLPHAGIILLRLPRETAQSKIERLTVLLGTHAEKLSKNFVVVDSKTIRIRPFLHPRV